MPSFQCGGRVSPRRPRGIAFPLRGAAFPLCRSIFMQGLHFKRRMLSRHGLQNLARKFFRYLISTRLRGSPSELAAWLEIHLAFIGRQVPPALRGLFIFDTETEKREDLSTFVEDNWKLGMSTDPSRDPTAAVVEWFTNLHSLGFSLSGNFNVMDFALNYSELLRGKRKLLKNLRKLTLKRVRRDMKSCADMIEFDFYDGRLGGIPDETKHLVWLLKHFKPRYSFLVRYHACHGDEFDQAALYEIMYTRLHELEKIDKLKYNRIIGKLRCCIRWINTDSDLVEYLTECFEYQKGYGDEMADPELLVGFQKALDDVGELAGLEWHRPNLGLQLLHEEDQ